MITSSSSSSSFTAVTETEVRQGLKGTAKPSDNCLFFVRDLQGVRVKMEDNVTGRYLDLNEDGWVCLIFADLAGGKRGVIPQPLPNF